MLPTEVARLNNNNDEPRFSVKEAETTLKNAQLAWDEQGQPLSTVFDDVYFSKDNGMLETQYVFLEQNHLLERWRSLNAGDKFVIAETGFGTGLNFLCAWQAWLDHSPENTQLHFISVERFPLQVSDLEKSLELWPALHSLSQQLLAQYPQVLVEGVHRLNFNGVTLTLIIGEASAGFAEMRASNHPWFCGPLNNCHVDAWFLDGFAPAKNPEMWTETLFAHIAALSKTATKSNRATTFATFTAAGIVKRGLKSAGFNTEKVPGFGKKREMLRGYFTGETASPMESSTALNASDSSEARDAEETRNAEKGRVEPHITQKEQRSHRTRFRYPVESPWFVPAHHHDKYRKHQHHLKTVAIIGGGLSGCFAANYLSKLGFAITLFEATDDICQKASGNPQGVVFAKLSPETGHLGDFNLLALMAAERFYQPLWKETDIGNRCGVLQLSFDEKLQTLHDQTWSRFGTAQQLFSHVTQTQASQLAGLDLEHGGLWFPNCGWINPRQLSRRLLEQSEPAIRLNTTVDKLKYKDGLWQLRDGNKSHLGEFSHVIIANAVDAKRFKQTQDLPLKSVRGQVTFVPSNSVSNNLQTVICSEGYIAPADASGHHCLGATFDPKSTNLDVLASDHQENIEHIRSICKPLTETIEAGLHHSYIGRVALRCSTPDYLPIVGPVPVAKQFDRDYARFSKNAREVVSTAGSYYPGLFTSLAYGSRALAYLPLATDLLCAHINATPNPVGLELTKALHPARFLVRDIARNKRQATGKHTSPT